MIVKQNKRQTFLYALGIFVVIAMCFFFAFFDVRKIPHDYSMVLDKAVVYLTIRIISFVGFVFFGAGEIYFIKQLFSKKPLAEICDGYFYDNSSATSLGKIAWSDMDRAYMRDGFLNIELKTPEKYFEKKNFLQTLMIKWNLKSGYGHVCISSMRFNGQSEKFVEEFSKRKAIEQL